MRRTLDEILACAREELRINPTITVYKMVDGLEKRRPANPFAGVHAAMRGLADSMTKAAVSFEGFNKAYEAAVAPLRHMRLP